MIEAIETMMRYERRDLENAKARAMKRIEDNGLMGAMYQLMDANEHKYALSLLEILKEQEG